MDLALCLLVFATVFGTGLMLARQRETVPDRAYQNLQRLTHGIDLTEDESIVSRRRTPRRELLTWFYRLNLLHRVENDLWQAGIYMRLSDFLLIVVLLFGAGVASEQLLFSGDMLISLVAGGIAAALPVFYIQLRRKRRLKAFAQQLPYALDLLKSSLEAGHSLMRGMQVVVQEFADPLGGEFRTVLEQTRIGLPLTRALEDLLTRVPEDDLRLLVVAVKVQAEVGSSLAHIIQRLSEIVRTRQHLQAQIYSLTAQSRMSGIIVGLLPVVMLGAFSVLQPSYTHTLFHDPSGIKLLKVAMGLDLAAFIIIRRLLRPTY
ncbi:MAG TPA: type II secretion system F family protein [Candidatus Binataceae bacterium]|nr:type II secretion system F family protein [Candidatus Binataceae bacterium]